MGIANILMLAGCSASPVTGSTEDSAASAHVAPKVIDAATALRFAISDAFPGAVVGATPRDAADARSIVTGRVDARLDDGASGWAGRAFRFAPADGVERHASVLTVRYESAAIASARLQSRQGKADGFFRDSKIMTPMVVGQKGPTVAIFFSESGDDPNVLRVLTTAARRWSTGD